MRVSAALTRSAGVKRSSNPERESKSPLPPNTLIREARDEPTAERGAVRGTAIPHQPPAAQRTQASRGGNSRLEHPAPQDRALRLASAGRRGLPHRPAARRSQLAAERPRPG